MKTFIILSSYFCVAFCYPWGHSQPVHDTPEVAAAKSKHLAAHAKARFSSLSELDRSWNSNHDDGSWKDDSEDGSWKDDSSLNHDNSWSHLDDESWKQQNDAHSNDDAKQPWAHHSTVSHYEKKWTGPIALPSGYDKHGAPLPVKDTPEVAAEKSKHFHLYAHAAAHAAPAHGSDGWKSADHYGAYPKHD